MFIGCLQPSHLFCQGISAPDRPQGQLTAAGALAREALEMELKTLITSNRLERKVSGENCKWFSGKYKNGELVVAWSLIEVSIAKVTFRGGNILMSQISR